MSTHYVSKPRIAQATPEAMSTLVQGTCSLLNWQGLPESMVLTADSPPMSREGMSFRRYEARRVLEGIYRVSASLVGSVISGGRPVINYAEFLVATSDEQYSPADDILALARNFAPGHTPRQSLRAPDDILSDLGSSVLDLSQGRYTMPTEYWVVLGGSPQSP